MALRLVVTGGSGLIGAEVCRVAVERGHEVISLSRQGRPTIVEGAWMANVAWHRADVLEPELWREHLVGCDTLIHCVGTFLETPAQGITFERINGDAAILVAQEAVQVGVGCMVFLSAEFNPPGLAASWLGAKRRAEEAIQALPIRSVFFRPSIVFGARRPISLFPSLLLGLATVVPGLQATLKNKHPLAAERVGEAALYAAQEPTMSGIVSPRKIESMAKALAWGL